MPTQVKEALALSPKIQGVAGEVLARHIGREDVVHATLLALVAGRPAFFLGPPGVDKTGTVESVVKKIAGAVFYDALMPTIISAEQLLVESTSIEETPTAEGGKAIRVRDTIGRAAKAHVLFADEIWKSEPRVLQPLLDLARGGEVRHEGETVITPLLAFLAASNELPDEEGNLGALWSRMTIRVNVSPLSRAGKAKMVAARLKRGRAQAAQAQEEVSSQLTLEEIKLLREARRLVKVPDEIVECVLDILQELTDNGSDFDWAWADDRRFGRLFDVLQAEALLAGRATVAKSDLWVLEWLLWNTPEQQAEVRAKVAPYCRTPLTEAQELVDALLAPGGAVAGLLAGDRTKLTQAVQQLDDCAREIARLKGEADAVMAQVIGELEAKLAETRAKAQQAIFGAN